MCVKLVICEDYNEMHDQQNKLFVCVCVRRHCAQLECLTLQCHFKTC